MTTPGQPGPDGAYVIGGGGNSYGQEMTDASAAHLMLGGFTSIASIANPLDAVGAAMGMFAESLLKLPLDVLKLFEPLIPGDLGAVFNTVGGAVNAIMGFFQTIGPLLTSTFNSFITTTYNVLSSGFQQILDIVNGLVVVPISSAVSGFKDWFTGLMGSTIPDLGTAISGAVNDVSDLVHDLLTAPATVLGALPQTLVSGLTGALSDVNGFVQGVVNAIIQAISGIPFVGGSIAAAIAALTGAVRTQQSNQQAAVVTVATANLGANQAWMAPYAIADVTYPRILHNILQTQGITTSASAGTAHTHDSFGTSGIVSGNIAYLPVTQAGTGTKRASFVTTRVSTVYDTVAMYLGQPTSGINNVFIEVYRKDSAGNIAQVSSQEVSASIPAGNPLYREFPLAAPIIANSGESYAVAMRNATTNSGVLQTRAVWAEDSGSLNFTGSDALKTSHTAAEVAAAQAANAVTTAVAILYPMPFAMLATTGAEPGQFTYTDNFDNRSKLGPLWLPKQSTPLPIKLSGNRATFNGTAAGDQLALYTAPVGGDEMLVEANLYGRAASSSTCGVMLCCNRELTQTVYLGVEQSLIHLYAGPWNALTQVGLWSTGIADAKFSVVNDPSTGIFTILRDGTDVQAWNSAGTIQFGEMFRYGGLRASKSVIVGSAAPGQMDNFTFRDN